MRITWRDGIATILVGFVAAATLAATGDWGWPVLGSYRAAVGVLALVGLFTCAVAGVGEGGTAKEPPAFRGAPGAIARLLHLGVGVLFVIGLIAPAGWVVLAMGADIVAIWLVGTAHHAVRAGPRAHLGGSPA